MFSAFDHYKRASFDQLTPLQKRLLIVLVPALGAGAIGGGLGTLAAEKGLGIGLGAAGGALAGAGLGAGALHYWDKKNPRPAPPTDRDLKRQIIAEKKEELATEQPPVEEKVAAVTVTPDEIEARRAAEDRKRKLQRLKTMAAIAGTALVAGGVGAGVGALAKKDQLAAPAHKLSPTRSAALTVSPLALIGGAVGARWLPGRMPLWKKGLVGSALGGGLGLAGWSGHYATRPNAPGI